MKKVWYTSKTLWVSFFVFIASILVVTGTIDIPEDQLHPDAAWVGIGWSIVQTVLRFVTKEPVNG